MFIVWCPRASSSARVLAKALKGKKQGSVQKVPLGSTVINWGDSECPISECLNSGPVLKAATNKRRCFEALSAAGVPVPRFATGKENVTWSGTTVVRHKLTGHSGEGIELVSPGQPLPEAPLYVEYIKKEDEYRIHVGRRPNDDGCGSSYQIIAAQRKARRLDVPSEQVNWQVRNHQNGFIFARENCNPQGSVLVAAKQALEVSGLDFGAVDVIYNHQSGKAYVLEINTAPGLEGQTIEDYSKFFKER